MTPLGNPPTAIADGYGLAGPLVVPGAPLGTVISSVLQKVSVIDPRTVRVTVMVLRFSPCFLSRFFLASASSAPNAELKSAPSPPHVTARPTSRREMAAPEERVDGPSWAPARPKMDWFMRSSSMQIGKASIRQPGSTTLSSRSAWRPQLYAGLLFWLIRIRVSESYLARLTYSMFAASR